MIGRVVTLSVLLLFGLFAGPLAGVTGAHYTPERGDQFAYNETVVLNDGTGPDYTGYTELSVTNGSVAVTGVLPNGTESAFYYNANSYENNTGGHYSWTSSGRFTFSASTFRYVSGTDNQTGYVSPYVWFFMNDSLPLGATFYLLNSEFSVVTTSYNFALETAAGSYVKAIFGEGNGSYERDDSYGVFLATYNWKVYFDPATGYIIGYVYTEKDTNNTTGDGFTLTDTLAVTHTSYPLTAGTAPPPPASSSGSPGTDWTLVAVVLVVIVVVIVVISLAISRSRRRATLPKHSATGQITYVAPPVGPPPAGVRLSPSDQPAVQQIVIKETVKVNCRYCGALIDSTAERCPYCGAART